MSNKWNNSMGNNQYTGYRYPPSKVFGADFETDHNPEETETWVCQWAISNGEREGALYGKDIDQFETALMSIVEQEKHAMFYFHNLKFDSSFLMGKYWKWTHEDGWEMDALVREGSPMNLKFNRDGLEFVIRDSMKKIPGDLKSIGGMIGIPKLDNPSESDFEPGWSDKLDYEMDSPDWQYVCQDARIAASAMRYMHANGQDALSASGQTYRNAKKKLNRNANDTGFSPLWKSRFIKLPIEIDQELREAYYGGLNVSQHRGLNIATPERPIVHEDIHSSYPTVMVYDLLPKGECWIQNYPPEPWEAEYKVWIAQRCVKMTLKEGMFPWFQFKNRSEYAKDGMTDIEPIVNTNTYHVLTLSNVDWKLLEEWYDLEFYPQFEETYYMFMGERGFMRPYIEQEFIGKESSKKGSLEYQQHKLNINSLYGRTGLRREAENVELVFDEDTQWYKWSSERVVKEEIESYIPYAIFCTAYARKRLLKNCMAVGPENVIHCDTDSVIHFGEPSPKIKHLDREDVDDPMDMLGAWGIESRPKAIIEGGFKKYMEFAEYPPRSMDDVIGTAMAGIPKKKKDGVPIGMWVELLDDPMLLCDEVTLGNKGYRIKSEWLRQCYIEKGMDPDSVNTTKLMPKHVKGGTLLTGSTYRTGNPLTLRYVVR